MAPACPDEVSTASQNDPSMAPRSRLALKVNVPPLHSGDLQKLRGVSPTEIVGAQKKFIKMFFSQESIKE